MQVTLACLKMLANELDMPFRRDTIEKVLKEEFSKNKIISSQFTSNILSFMGLYTSIGKVPKNLGTRLPTPSIIKWKESYALVKQTN